MRVTLGFALGGGVAGHGSMTYPKPRNAYSSPGTNPSTGADLSCVGDACFWYQVGCHIGCPSCKTDVSGKDLYPNPHCTVSEGLMEPTNNDPEFRTWDPLSQSECGDWTKYNPWRAPGKAPVADPCGVASGFSRYQTGVEVPQGYSAGDFGSQVLPEAPATYWQAGSTAQVGWALSAQHGGGYSYRLCPKSSDISEKCFQANVLTFANANTTIHFDDGSEEKIQIPTKTFIAEDGAHWRSNPIPGCACDNGIACSTSSSDFLKAKSDQICAGQYPKSGTYSSHGRATDSCTTGTMFQPGFDRFTQGYLTSFAGQAGGNKFSVMDEVNVPSKVGEYVLSWRWDCEETDQVWNSCADIVITTSPVPAPTPAPTPTPTPPPSGDCSGFTPDAKTYACYYHGCSEFNSDGTCKTCCSGCHIESSSGKGSYCMEDKTTV